ncbi:MAG: bifunctional folylpolyglutamate synthase/dihydrofolate synthase [Anaerolineales bacterium]
MNSEQEYQETLNYLYSFVDYSLTKADRLAQAKFDLSRMYKLMQELGNPHQAYPSIHITGTKGKGSVTAMCTSCLQEAGYKVGMYTSPHLEDYAERIQINGENIPHETLTSLVNEIRPIVESIKDLTTFEITTAIAFLYFARSQVDVAVVEVGLGGRLDATNVLLPKVSVITSISYDHTFVLGNTLAEIAREKGGIIKNHIPLVSAPQEPEALEVLQEIASQHNSPMVLIGKDVIGKSITANLDGQTIEICDYQGGVSNTSPRRLQLQIPLLGEHQIENATVAYAALEQLRAQGLPIEDKNLLKGFEHTIWPGRFEVICRNPMIILDCAHNRESMQQLKQTITQFFPKQKTVLIFGASEDKDISGMFEDILPGVEKLIVTRSFHPRAISAEKLVELATPYHIATYINENVAEALWMAIQDIRADQIIVITGSIFVVAEARHAWFNEDRFHPYYINSRTKV